MAKTDDLDQLLNEGHRRSYWRDLTEEQLLEIKFTTSDPEALDGMSDDPPPEDEEPRVEFAYDVKGRALGKARCVHCKYPNHYEGFVLVYPSAQRRMVGRDCGKKLHGADFDLFMKDFDAARDRAGYLHRRRAALVGRNSLMDGVARLQEHPSIAAFSELRRAFCQAFPGLYQVLSVVANAGGGLQIEDKVRDLRAEERRDQQFEGMTKTELKKARQEGKMRPIYLTVPRNIGILGGTAFFQTGETPGTVIARLEQELDGVFAQLEGDAPTTSALKATMRRLDELLDQLEQEVARLRSPIQAFEFGNLKTIADWAMAKKSGQDRARYEAGFGFLRKTDADVVTEVRFPAGYAAPAGAFVAAFRNALGAVA